MQAGGVLRVSAAVLLVAVATPSPEALQAAYDRARETGDRATIARVERFDHRPAGLKLPATLPRVPDPRAHPEATRDAALSLRLERLGRSFDGWAAFWSTTCAPAGPRAGTPTPASRPRRR